MLNEIISLQDFLLMVLNEKCIYVTMWPLLNSKLYLQKKIIKSNASLSQCC